jgi:hypothetical protein
MFLSSTPAADGQLKTLSSRMLNGRTTMPPTIVRMSSHWTSIRAIEQARFLPLLTRMMWSYFSFQPAQQEDSNPSIPEYSGSSKPAQEQNLGDGYGAMVNQMWNIMKVLKF